MFYRQMKKIKQNELQQRHSTKSKKGFSLVELMVGSAALTLVLAGTFSGLGQAICISEVVQSSNFAAQFLQSEMDDIHLLQWSEVANLQGKEVIDPEDWNFSTVPLRDAAFTRIVSSRGTSQKEIRLIVEWTDLRGIRHSNEYVTYYTKDGLFDYSYRSL